MSSALRHKQRSRRSHGQIIFKSRDCAKHDHIGIFPIYKNSKNRKKY